MDSAPPTEVPAKALTLVALAAALLLMVQGAQLMRNELGFSRAGTEVSFWGRADYQPSEETILATTNTISTLVANCPGHPDYFALQANAAVWQAYWAQRKEDREVHAARAISSQYCALRSRPAHRHGWVKMVEYASRVPGEKAIVVMAQEKLAALSVGSAPDATSQ